MVVNLSQIPCKTAVVTVCVRRVLYLDLVVQDLKLFDALQPYLEINVCLVEWEPIVVGLFISLEVVSGCCLLGGV